MTKRSKLSQWKMVSFNHLTDLYGGYGNSWSYLPIGLTGPALKSPADWALGFMDYTPASW